MTFDVVVAFVMPIGQLLIRSVHNDTFSAKMPDLKAWFDESLGAASNEAAYATFVIDLRHAQTSKTVALIGTRANYELSATRSLFIAVARRANDLKPPYARQYLILVLIGDLQDCGKSCVGRHHLIRPTSILSQ